jgi:hypothetical protein
LIHVKVFGYAGWSGPTHFLNVYLKSGGNHRSTRRKQLGIVRGIICKIIKKDRESKVIVLGDMNESVEQVMKHLDYGLGVKDEMNFLAPVHVRGSSLTHFPMAYKPTGIDHILVNENASRYLKGARVLRGYDASDHRPLSVYPLANQPPERVDKERTSFDNKMIRLRGDLIAHDNRWDALTHRGYNIKADERMEIDMLFDQGDEEVAQDVTDTAENFIATFNTICQDHGVKKVRQRGSEEEFPRK